MVARTFRFSVDAQGTFTYDSPEPPSTDDPASTTWMYTHRDTLDFKCSKGPFTVKLRRTDIAPGAGGAKDPYGPVQAQEVGGEWVAHVSVIDDGLSPDVRQAIWKANGFIAKYRYVLGLVDGGKVLVDDGHLGIHWC